jgi:phosphatidylglycerophosphatase A
LRELFLTFFYTGLSPKAPGTVGSFAALIVGWAVLTYLDVSTLFLMFLFVTLVGIREITLYEEQTQTHDQSKIVIDEVSGMWLALCISGATMTQMILSFLFFRLLDIYKPSIIGRIDKGVKGGLGVMGDDVVAGAFAGLLSSIVFGFVGDIFG